ncbi:tRNA (N6-threonylcarbamoyladenosine(37)-N6)-methyltransferase TrmO [Candidatus Aerophobetes bacterium]|nr:tRNA (N6-threonylcarbamoyladenosine(37)-N6)-methyltransferase TrmO [Candidatus Aerophobetes bacterium]
MRIYPIGVVRSSNQDSQKIEIFEDFSEGLKGIEASRYVWVLYWFHKVSKNKRKLLQVHPGGDLTRPKRGVFTTRSPIRPNPIGLTRVELVGTQDNILIVKGLDAFENSPVLDIKPF